MALDFGERRIGVAITDETRMLAQPLETITPTRGDRSQGVKRVVEIVAEYEVGQIVIGLPLHLDGSSGSQVERTRTFGERVARETGLPVEYLDERWTSVEAERALAEGGVSDRKKRGKIDPIAAAILLRTWLARTGA